MVLKTTSNKTEVRKEGGRPPFYPLATTLHIPVVLSAARGKAIGLSVSMKIAKS
jgi:hypothetical protein